MYQHTRGCVRDPTLTRDKTNLRYISGDNPHFTSRFCEDKLNLNSLSNNNMGNKKWSPKHLEAKHKINQWKHSLYLKLCLIQF